jgi:hypothetical protein
LCFTKSWSHIFNVSAALVPDFPATAFNPSRFVTAREIALARSSSLASAIALSGAMALDCLAVAAADTVVALIVDGTLSSSSLVAVKSKVVAVVAAAAMAVEVDAEADVVEFRRR